jgi:tetratricopeptide (TPR) repeat protein
VGINTYLEFEINYIYNEIKYNIIITLQYNKIINMITNNNICHITLFNSNNSNSNVTNKEISTNSNIRNMSKFLQDIKSLNIINNSNENIYINEWSCVIDSILYKDIGTYYMSQCNDYNNALFYYTMAIACNTTNEILYSNRCATYLYLNELSHAYKDAEICINLNNNWSKAHIRYGSVLYRYDRLEEALKAYEMAMSINTSNNISNTDILLTYNKIKSELDVRKATEIAHNVSKANKNNNSFDNSNNNKNETKNKTNSSKNNCVVS